MISSATLFIATLALNAVAVLGAPIRISTQLVPRSLDNSESSVRFAREESFPDVVPVVARAVSDAVPVVKRDTETETLVRRYPRAFIYNHLEKRGTTITKDTTIHEVIKHDTPADTIAFNNGHPQPQGNSGSGSSTSTSTTVTQTDAATPTSTGAANPPASTSTGVPTPPAGGNTPTDTTTKPVDTTNKPAGNTDTNKPTGSTDPTTSTDPTNSTTPTTPTTPNGGSTTTDGANGATTTTSTTSTTDGSTSTDGTTTTDGTQGPPSRRGMEVTASSRSVSKREIAYSAAAWAASLRRRAL